MAYGVLRMVYGAWRMAHGAYCAWCMVHGALYLCPPTPQIPPGERVLRQLGMRDGLLPRHLMDGIQRIYDGEWDPTDVWWWMGSNGYMVVDGIKRITVLPLLTAHSPFRMVVPQSPSPTCWSISVIVASAAMTALAAATSAALRLAQSAALSAGGPATVAGAASAAASSVGAALREVPMTSFIPPPV
jgi:hypothetical protein